jgi:uncharacterized membrane protein YcgQ (UPF0703/DUF1980 family)
MALTYEPIATAYGNGSTTTITFSSIASSWTDLILVMNVQGSSSAGIKTRFNGDTSSIYSKTAIYGDGASVSSFRETDQTSVNTTNLGTTMGITTMQIQNYKGNTYKTGFIRRNEPSSLTEFDVFLWRSTSAITQIEISSTAPYNSSSIFTLYGIAAA